MEEKKSTNIFMKKKRALNGVGWAIEYTLRFKLVSGLLAT